MSVAAYAKTWLTRGIHTSIIPHEELQQYKSHWNRTFSRSDTIAVHFEQEQGLASFLRSVQKSDSWLRRPKIKAKLIAHIRDNPDAPYLDEMFRQIDERVLILFTDKESTAYANKVHGQTGASFDVATHVWLSVPDAHFDITARPRSINVLSIDGWQNPVLVRQKFHQEYPRLAILYDASIEEGVFNYEIPVWDIVDHVLQRKRSEISFGSVVHKLLTFGVNQYIRQARRKAMLDSLSCIPITLVYRGAHESLKLHPDSRLLDPMPFFGAVDLMSHAKCVVATVAKTPSALSERVLTALRYGCGVITNPSPAIDGLSELGATAFTVDERLDEWSRVVSVALATHENGHAMRHSQAIADQMFDPTIVVDKLIANL